jgi:hypothetical protein
VEINMISATSNRITVPKPNKAHFTTLQTVFLI